MNKKLLNLLRTDEVQDKIKDLYCKLDKERFSEGSHMGSGWGWTIILDEDGNIDYMYSPLNSTRQDVFEDKAIEVAVLTDNAEVTTDDMGDIWQVEDYDEFKNFIAEQFDARFNKNDYENEDDYKDEKNDYIYENTTWMNYYDFNEENFHKIEKEAWEIGSEYYSYDKIIDILYNLIQDLEEIENDEFNKVDFRYYR